MTKQSHRSKTIISWGTVRRLLILILIPTQLVLAQESPLSQSEETTEVFILRQLIEIQHELKELRKEITDLRNVVNNPKRNTAPPSAAVSPPSAPVTVQLEKDDPVLGDREAKVAIVEFTDYQCPFCSQYHSQTFPELKKTFIDTGKAQYIIRDFPLDFHAHAKSAAIAANCAGEQNAYWEMNDQLFSKQSELGEDLYRQSAESLGLAIDRFLACINQTEQEQAVMTDLAYGQQIGVDGTPAFFIGRVEDGQLLDVKKITGAQPLSVFLQALTPLLGDEP